MFSIHLCCRISQECGPEFFVAFRIYLCCFDRNVVHSAQIAVIPEFSGVRTKFMIICLWPFSFFQVSPCNLSYDHLFACAYHDLFFIQESIQSVYFFYLHVSDHCSVVLISLCNKAVHPMPPYSFGLSLGFIHPCSTTMRARSHRIMLRDRDYLFKLSLVGVFSSDRCLRHLSACRAGYIRISSMTLVVQEVFCSDACFFRPVFQSFRKRRGVLFPFFKPVRTFVFPFLDSLRFDVIDQALQGTYPGGVFPFPRISSKLPHHISLGPSHITLVVSFFAVTANLFPFFIQTCCRPDPCIRIIQAPVLLGKHHPDPRGLQLPFFVFVNFNKQMALSTDILQKYNCCVTILFVCPDATPERDLFYLLFLHFLLPPR